MIPRELLNGKKKKDSQEKYFYWFTLLEWYVNLRVDSFQEIIGHDSVQ